MTQSRIVVGVDGSPTSATALAWALEAASRSDAEVEVLHAWRWAFPEFGVVAPDTPVHAAGLARRTVDGQLEKALADRPAGSRVAHAHARTGEGDASDALVAASVDADLLVLGVHGTSALRRRLLGPALGSVASACLSRAAAPVVVVPPDVPVRPARVVVGVDGSASSVRALRWAAAQGASLGVPVVAVLAWQLTTLPSPAVDAGVPPLSAWDASAHTVLAEAVAEAGLTEGDLEQVVVHAPAAAGLLDSVRPDDLLVLGDRGRGGFARLLLGSVSRQCAEHALCAVVVVPPEDRRH